MIKHYWTFFVTFMYTFKLIIYLFNVSLSITVRLEVTLRGGGESMSEYKNQYSSLLN